MIPILNRVELTQLTVRQQRKICRCENVCKQAVTITTYNDGLTLCWNDARRHLFNMITLLDDGKYNGWSEQDEQFIIDLVKKKGMYRGINREIAEALGRTYRQAKSKTRRMKEKGLI